MGSHLACKELDKYVTDIIAKVFPYFVLCGRPSAQQPRIRIVEKEKDEFVPKSKPRSFFERS